jgi:hypothetical protein
MFRGTPIRSDRGAGGSLRRSILEFLAGIRGGTRIAAAVVLLACFGGGELWAQTAPQKLIVHRSTRAIPHRFIVHPNEATVAVNQTQHFEVTDAQGNPVAVRWNVSGIGCSGLDCGTIDDEGNYRTPPSLPKPHVVTVEGVLLADPNYSVLTQVRLEDSITAAGSAAPGQVAAAKTRPSTAPEVERKILASNSGFPPLPNAIAAAPAVGRQLASNSELPKLPTVVAAAPIVGRQNLAGKAESMPLPNVVAAAPAVGQPSRARSVELETPSVVAAAPAVGRPNLASKTESMPLPNVIAAAPAIGQQTRARSVELETPSVVAAAPAVGRQNLATKAESLPPNVIAPAPTVGRQSPARNAESLPTNVVAPAPTVGAQSLARIVELTPQPTIVAALGPIPPKIPIGKTQPLAPSAVGRPSVAGGGVLSPMPDAAAVPGGTAVSTQHGPVVTYRDGQLTIDAENSTLAAVLALIAEKTGAVIDVPPGSGQERIFEHTGPALANDVLERLLNGSPFNFIIVSSPQHLNQPAEVLLSLHGPDTDTPSVAVVPPQPSLSPPLWTPPQTPASTAAVLSLPVDTPPKEPLSPEALGEMMKERARLLRDQLQKQQ